MVTMPDKNREPDDSDDDTEKNPPGRPRTLSPELDKRHQLRCSTRDFDAWEKHAAKIGFPNVSAWLRKVANDALPARLRKQASR